MPRCNEGFRKRISKYLFFTTKVKSSRWISHQRLPSLLMIYDSTQQLFPGETKVGLFLEPLQI